MFDKLSVDDKFIRSRLQILQNYPFMGKYAIKLGVIEDNSIDTAATNGLKILYNRDFMNDKSEGEFNFIYLHEILHILLSHITRKGTRDHKIWNYACDYEIHNIMAEMINLISNQNKMKLDMPVDVLYNTKYTNKTCYEIYEDLYANAKTIKGHLLGDHSLWGSLGKKEQEAVEEAVADYIRGCGLGTGSSRLDRLIGDIYSSKKDWREELRDFIILSPKDYSFMTPDRRFLDGDFIIPDIGIGEKVDKLVICIDTSGSVKESEITSVISEVKAMQESSGGELEGTVCFFHSFVYNQQKIKSVDEIDLSVLESGGTDIVEAINEVDKLNDEETIIGLVILTDGCAELPTKTKGGYKVLWVITGNPKFIAPFGNLVHLE